MTPEPFQFDRLSQQNLQVMQAYTLRQKTLKATSEEFDGWLERIDTLNGFTPQDLTQQHGQLIAQGFLKFEISGRSAGLKYQISPQGQAAMERALSRSAGSEEAEEDSDDHHAAAA
ncbi:MAG: hypothetical protein R3C49_22790 [Planctomycetaceae bacterium]